ncbi:MAG: polysaccharide biosynthesis C-terminal domain-containing protein, partial [Clostridia bacterium]
MSSVFLITAGAIGMLIFLIFAPQIATLQGNADTTTAFRIVAPAIFFVAATGAFKGYFQGNVNMVPSSATLVIEQIIKLVIGLACALYFMPDTLRAVSGAVLGITISEMLSFIIMVCVYLVENKGKIRLPLATTVERKECYSKIFALAIPIALGGFIMQLTQFVDSVMVVNLLGGVGATSLYGLWTGPVNSMLGLPIALSSGVAISTLPSITQTYTKRDDVQLRKNFNTAIKLTLVIALPSAFGMILMSDSIIGMLYKGLPAEEIAISAKLLSISGISIVFLSVAQTSISILQAVGKPYVSVLTLFGAVVVKAVANLILLPIDSINIYGAGISETLCFAFVAISDIIYLNKKLKMKLDSEVITKPLAACLCMTLALVAINALFVNVSRSTIGALIEITVAVVV